MTKADIIGRFFLGRRAIYDYSGMGATMPVATHVGIRQTFPKFRASKKSAAATVTASSTNQ
jgi:hypothetical protein